MLIIRSGKNVTSPSTSNFKALAHCQTYNLPCEQENVTIENDMSNIDTEDTEDDDQEISGEMMDYALEYFKKWIARLDKEDQTWKRRFVYQCIFGDFYTNINLSIYLFIYIFLCKNYK